ncbi:hypothetical protein B6U99_05390 [Candidatus Geothermarchaeota archaeon ex4572_27]|nr:MAG: hypothetical protein B6U99_05390 [Candidatus Geothermarchaeota archaeon ex4572_27]
MIKLHGPGSPDASRIIRVGDQVTFGVSNDGYRLGGWVYVDGWQGGWGESGYSLELYKWYHVMMIWDETARRYHVNGQHVKSVSFTGSINGSAGPTRVGGWPDESPQWFNGLIAFVRVYDERLFNWLGEQGKTIDWFVKYNMLNYHSPVRAGLVLWLDFEEGHGDKAYDKSGQGNHGTIHGATWVRVGQYELRAEVGL